ncbi:MAG: phage antirepressor protein [Patescibacteria group bacterium]
MSKTIQGKTTEAMISIVRFENSAIRRHWDEDQEKQYSSVVDIIGAITGSSIPKRYWTDLKKRLKDEGFEVYDKIVQLKFLAKDGKKYATDCADVETMLRIIQSVSSPKADPIKQWLAHIGYERIEETIDPEKDIDRGMATYLLKGYSPEWINQRLRSIEVRKELTQEWSQRGIKNGGEFAQLTDILTHRWSGLRTRDYKKVKGLQGHNLRDHMTTLELVLNMLAEAGTTEIARADDAQGFDGNRDAAVKGGGIAGDARKKLEETTGKPVISSSNRLPKSSDRKFLN